MISFDCESTKPKAGEYSFEPYVNIAFSAVYPNLMTEREIKEYFSIMKKELEVREAQTLKVLEKALAS